MNNIERNDFLLVSNWEVENASPLEVVNELDKWFFANKALSKLEKLRNLNNGCLFDKDPRYIKLLPQLLPRNLKDVSTGKLYLNESPGCVRVKCLLLSLATPFIQPLFLISNVAYRILRIGRNCLDKTYRQNELKIDALRILATPFAYVGLELSALYGLFSPYNGRKLYATLERFLYHTGKKPKNFVQTIIYADYKLAPCFQPGPTVHFFGGSIDKKDAM